MTWNTSYSSQSTINIGPHKGGSEVMFHLKELLKAVGWVVKSSSDGTTYNSSGDEITSSSSGSGGMDNNSAWYRIQDPGALREYVFQRSTNNYTWTGMYSASDKFTGGTPGATTRPTATDEQGIFKASTSAQTMFSSSASYTYQIAAQDAAHNGVYAWWLTGASPEETTPENTCIFAEALDSTYSSGDNDPIVHFGNSDAPVVNSTGSTSISTSAASVRGWMRYGEVDEEWSGITTVYYAAQSFNAWPYFGPPTNPHNNKYMLMPIPLFRHSSTGSVVGVKGVTKYIKWAPSLYGFAYPSVVADISDNYMTFGEMMFPGIPDGTTIRL